MLCGMQTVGLTRHLGRFLSGVDIRGKRIEVPTAKAGRQGRAVLRLLSLRFWGESADNPRNYDFAKYYRVRPDALLPAEVAAMGVYPSGPGYVARAEQAVRVRDGEQ